MSRGQGRVDKDPNSGNWWLDYSLGGKRHRESSGTTVKADALDILRTRVGDRKSGKVIGGPERVFLAEYTKGEDGKETLSGGLLRITETQMRLAGRRWLVPQQQLRDHIPKYFTPPEQPTVCARC